MYPFESSHRTLVFFLGVVKIYGIGAVFFGYKYVLLQTLFGGKTKKKSIV